MFGALSILAIAPVLYFAACSSGGDDGGGGGTPPPSGGGSANQFAYVIASAASEIQANNLDGSGNITPIGGPIATGVVTRTTSTWIVADVLSMCRTMTRHSCPATDQFNQDGSLNPMNPAPGSPVTADVQTHSSVIDQTDAFLYVVSGTGASTLTAYTINTSTGIPTAIAGQSFAVGTHARNVTISPNNLFL